jgi:chromosome segregation ATPase
MAARDIDPPAVDTPEQRAARRVFELRAREESELGAVRAALARSEGELDTVRAATAELRSVLPTRVEAAVSRALLGADGGALGRRLDDLHAVSAETTAAVRTIADDVLAERITRVEDLELVVDLLSRGFSATRADVQRLERRVERFESRLDRIDGALRRIEASMVRITAAVERDPGGRSTPPPFASR